MTYSYDSVGRFGEVDTAVPSSFSATYGYVTNSNLVGTVTFPNSIIATRHYEDHRDLLDWIENKVGSTSVSKYSYGPYNDAAGRRTGADWSGSAFSLSPGQGNDSIAYGYNSRSEVTGATATNRTAYDFDYSYDNILLRQRLRASGPSAPADGGYGGQVGNRVTYAVQGQTPPTEYVMPTNGLNQYSGTTDPDEAFEYDFDGNLTLDRDFEYTWDAENRLIKAEAAGVVKVEFAYDYMSRRVRKVSYDWATDHWSLFTDHLFVYDGWNPVLELASGGGLPSSTARTWGLDLSQTLQGAGGVGGLLATHFSGQVNAFVYDGNGNVSEALRASDGNIEAHYEYDPFGNTTASSGTWADANPYRFSTKWFDDELSLYYYGLRYYSPRLGRWVSRDPINEDHWIVVLLSFLNNNPVNACDVLGLAEMPPWPNRGPYSTQAVLDQVRNLIDKWKAKIEEYKTCVREGRGTAPHRDRLQPEFCDKAKELMQELEYILRTNPTLSAQERNILQQEIDIIKGPYTENCPAREKLPEPNATPESCPCPAPNVAWAVGFSIIWGWLAPFLPELLPVLL